MWPRLIVATTALLLAWAPAGAYSVDRVPSRRVFLGTSAWIATASAARAVDVKVTPLAHTFVTSAGTATKPIRENDATRYFTNAKVVLIFGEAGKTANEVLDLTVARKAGRGPGVTPGQVRVLSSDASFGGSIAGGSVVKDVTVSAIADAVKSVPDGDCLLIGPIPSQGTAKNGKLTAEVASNLGLEIGGKKEGGVVSVLVNGPTQGLKLEEGGYPTSDLLWYGL